MVRELVDEQFPVWRGLAIMAVRTEGTVNAIFRIGERFAVRFPLQPGDVGSVRRRLESEAAAARELAGRTRFATPEPVALGEPGAGYPLPSSVQTWLPGVTATDEDPGEFAAFAHDLAEFIGPESWNRLTGSETTRTSSPRLTPTARPDWAGTTTCRRPAPRSARSAIDNLRLLDAPDSNSAS